MLKVRSDYIYYGTEWSKIYINLCYIVSAENWELYKSFWTAMKF